MSTKFDSPKEKLRSTQGGYQVHSKYDSRKDGGILNCPLKLVLSFIVLFDFKAYKNVLIVPPHLAANNSKRASCPSPYLRLFVPAQ